MTSSFRTSCFFRVSLFVIRICPLASAGCHASPSPQSELGTGGWVLAEHGGILAWVPEELPVTVQGWVEHRPGFGQVGVVVVRTPGRARLHALPLRPDIVLLTPGVVETDGEARFEFAGPVPGRAGIRVWASRGP